MKNYIFCTDLETEQARLEILNKSCNDHTKSILQQYIIPGSKVLECAFGEGQISDWINTIPKINYMGFDSDIGRVSKRYQEDKYFYGDILKLKEIKQIKKKKFDVIYARWILAYLPQYDLKDIILTLHSLLKRNGVLILEECDLYKAYITKDDRPVVIPIFEEWINLSRFVQVMINTCNFRMGNELLKMLTEEFKTEIKTYSYQPVLEGIDKRIITLGLKSSSNSLIEKGILTEEQINSLISEIDYAIVGKDNIKLNYVETTIHVINK